MDVLFRLERMDDVTDFPGQVFAYVIARIDSNLIDSVEEVAYQMLQSVQTNEVRNTDELFPLNPNLVKLRQEEEDERSREEKSNSYGRRDGFIT